MRRVTGKKMAGLALSRASWNGVEAWPELPRLRRASGEHELLDPLQKNLVKGVSELRQEERKKMGGVWGLGGCSPRRKWRWTAAGGADSGKQFPRPGGAIGFG